MLPNLMNTDLAFPILTFISLSNSTLCCYTAS
jgi:hypothetical protein